MKQEGPKIITLTGENGQTIDFSLEAHIMYEDYEYCILRPVNKYEGLNPDEAIVFRVENDEFFIETNDEVIDKVGEIYNSMD